MNTYVFCLGSRFNFRFTFQIVAETPREAVRLAREQLFEQMAEGNDYCYLKIDLDFGLSAGKLIIYTSDITEDEIESVIPGNDPGLSFSSATELIAERRYKPELTRL